MTAGSKGKITHSTCKLRFCDYKTCTIHNVWIGKHVSVLKREVFFFSILTSPNPTKI